jgi:putative membrane protein
VFARERTYSAWVRTGLTLVAAGLGVTQLLRALEPRWMVYSLGALLAGMGGAIFALSFWRYWQPLEDEERHGRAGVPTWLVAVLTLVLLVGTGLALWLLS